MKLIMLEAAQTKASLFVVDAITGCKLALSENCFTVSPLQFCFAVS